MYVHTYIWVYGAKANTHRRETSKCHWWPQEAQAGTACSPRSLSESQCSTSLGVRQLHTEICMHICMWVCTHSWDFFWNYAAQRREMHGNSQCIVCVCVCVCVRACVRSCVRVYTHTYSCIFIYSNIFTHNARIRHPQKQKGTTLCVCVCMYVHVCTYKHTRVCMYIWRHIQYKNVIHTTAEGKKQILDNTKEDSPQTRYTCVCVCGMHVCMLQECDTYSSRRTRGSARRRGTSCPGTHAACMHTWWPRLSAAGPCTLTSVSDFCAGSSARTCRRTCQWSKSWSRSCLSGTCCARRHLLYVCVCVCVRVLVKLS